MMTETIGQLLQRTRLAKKMTIPEIVKATHIRTQYLEALEADAFDVFTSAAQARGFLTNYAAYLGVMLEDLSFRGNQSSSTQSARLTMEESRKSGEPNDIPEALPAVILPDQKQELDQGQSPGGISDPSPTGLTPEFRKIKSQRIRMARTEFGQKQSTNSHPLTDAITHPDGDLESVPGQTNTAKTEERSTTDHTDLTSVVNILPVSEQQPSAEIFESIGTQLHQRRELLGISISEIESHIHVRKHYIEAIEAGKLDQLPSTVQARGMISNYSIFLDMDVDALLLQFAEGLQSRLAERHPRQLKIDDRRSQFSVPAFFRRYLAIEFLIIGAFIVLIVAFIIWGTANVFTISSSVTEQVDAPSISDILMMSPSPEPTIDSLISTNNPAATLIASGSSLINETPVDYTNSVHLILVASERAFVIVTVDGQIKFDGRTVPDTAYPFDGQERIEVVTGNGASIKVIFNGIDRGTMGSRGQVVHFVYTIDAISTPTPTITPTVTSTPIPSATPLPSLTPRVTQTITP